MGGRNKRTNIAWQKSSHSIQGDCIEVAIAPARVLIRDSKDRDGSTLCVHTSAWRAVLSIIKHLPR